MKMLIDIDGVLGYKNVSVLVSIYNKYMHLELKDESVIKSITEFENHEEVRAYQQVNGQKKYEYIRELLVFTPDHIRQLGVIDASQKGVLALSQQYEITYCTARKTLIPKWDEDLQEATYTWLMKHRFPQSDTVVFCDNTKAKLLFIAQCLEIRPQTIVLIDDSYATLVEYVTTLPQEQQQRLQQYLILGAYGAQEIIGNTPCRMVAFPDWKDIHTFMKEVSHGREREEKR